MSAIGSNPQTPRLEQLLAERADLWRGRSSAAGVGEGIGTGFPELDQLLPWHGWPGSGLTELLTDQPAIGLTLLLPALRCLCPGIEGGDNDHCDQPAQSDGQDLSIICSDGWLLLVNPPYIPYAPALAAKGLDLGRVLVVDAPGQGAWVLEQALRSGGCTAVIGWSTADEANKKERGWATAILRRLQLAASERSTPAFLLRPMAAAFQASPAPLRLDVETAPNGLDVVLRKLRGGRVGLRLSLSGSVGPPPIGSNPKGKRGVDPNAFRRAEIGLR
ncbi:MAG: hypothetical protein GVY22_01985 [Gammaproteobacteria bacterium]|jgi:cell division inhibitor SulA|nr:hypothetical protein [Gammaproteobacteria bacterium]